MLAHMRVVVLSEFKESMKRNGAPFAGIDPAPEHFQLMWERRARSIDVRPAAWMVGNTRPQFRGSINSRSCGILYTPMGFDSLATKGRAGVNGRAKVSVTVPKSPLP
jgi:hypothetical protein